MVFKAKGDYYAPPEVYNFRIYLVTFLVSLSGAAYGYDIAYIGSTIVLPSFRREFGIDKLSISQQNSIISNIISTFQGGCILGALLAPPFSEHLGRRKSIIISTVLFLLGGFLQIWSNGRVDMMYVGRVLNGIGGNMGACVVTVYIAEFAPPAIRGRLIGFWDIMLQFARLVGFWINYGTKRHIPDSSNAQWRIPVAVQVIPAGLLLFSMFFIWESPRWLAQKDRLEETLATLSRIRQLPPDHPYVLKELADIKDQISRERQFKNGATYLQLLKEFASRGYRNRLGIVMCVQVFTNLTGFGAIGYYTPAIFKSLGVSTTSTALFATGIYGVVTAVSSLIFFTFLLDKLGRRKSLLIGSCGVAVPMFYMGAYVAIAKPSKTDVEQSPAGWAAMVAIYVFGLFFSSCWAGVGMLVPSEIFPLRLRTVGVTIASITSWVCSFSITKATPYMLTSMGYGTYIFFGSAMPIAFIWGYFFLPETAGHTLEEMDVIFGVPTAVNEKQDYGKAGDHETSSESGSNEKQEIEMKKDVNVKLSV